MAKLDLLIPFVLYFEAGVNKKYLSLPNEQIFTQAKKTGYANDPVDVGGVTMCGVTLNTFKAYCRKHGFKDSSVKALRAIDYKTWYDIIKTMFWDKWKADDIKDQSVANMLVDWSWASGSNGIIIPQRLLGVSQDGIVGIKTITALNSKDGKSFFQQLKDARHKYHADIIANSIRKYEKRIGRKSTLAEQKRYTNKKYENGWNRRVNSIIYNGFNYE